MILISDHFHGRVDVVPGCCYVATEFVCAWFFPLLPRRSLLFFRNSEVPAGDVSAAARPSLGSALATHAAPIIAFWAGGVPDGEVAVPVRLSLKSVLFAYLKPVLSFLVISAAITSFLVLSNFRVKPAELPRLLGSLALYLAVPCISLYLIRLASRASRRRRLHLARLKDLPGHVVARLLEGQEIDGGLSPAVLDPYFDR